MVVLFFNITSNDPFAKCLLLVPSIFGSIGLEDLVPKELMFSPLDNKCKSSTELQVEIITWPFSASHVTGVIGQKESYHLAEDYKREILFSKENKNSATKLHEEYVEHK